MPTIKPPPPRIDSRSDDAVDQLTLARARAATFFERNRTALMAALAAVVLGVLGVVAYRIYDDRRETAAAEAMGAILTEYEAGNFRAALDGTEDRPGLLEIAERYGSTETGNLATFFAADALFQLGEYDEARTFFARYDAGEDLLGASALAGQAALAEREDEHARAAELYERAAGAYASAATAPDYLLAAARAHEAAGNLAGARTALERVRDDFEESPAATTVEMELARLDARATADGQPAAADTPDRAPGDSSSAVPALAAARPAPGDSSRLARPAPGDSSRAAGTDAPATATE